MSTGEFNAGQLTTNTDPNYAFNQGKYSNDLVLSAPGIHYGTADKTLAAKGIYKGGHNRLSTMDFDKLDSTGIPLGPKSGYAHGLEYKNTPMRSSLYIGGKKHKLSKRRKHKRKQSRRKLSKSKRRLHKRKSIRRKSSKRKSKKHT